MVKSKKKNTNLNEFWHFLKNIGYAFAIFAGGFSAGWYIHRNISSVEFHEKEMQLYNLHQQMDERKNMEIIQLESDKRDLEKELYNLRKESLKQTKHND